MMAETPEFIPGLKLSEMFYQEAVRPVLEAEFPGLQYSAALIGYGSDVIGFDTPESADHMWGPRLYLFVPIGDEKQLKLSILEKLSDRLPPRFHGYSTHYVEADETGVRIPLDVESGPVNPLVWIYSTHSYLLEYLGNDLAGELGPEDWLVFSEHKLLSLVSGKVFYDGLGELEKVRGKIAFYPYDLWLYLLAAEWQKIGQEEPFVGRCGTIGDDLGSRLIAARLVRSVMRLGFLMEKQYPPYSKWLGTGFHRLDCAPILEPLLQQSVEAITWQTREAALAKAYQAAARIHNHLAITSPVRTGIEQFHQRPYQVIQASQIADQITQEIQDPAVKALPDGVGSLNQWIESTDVLTNPELGNRLRYVYR